MSEGKPRLARLAAILTQLQSKSLVTAREIADKYGVSIRTVYRDIRTLEQSGIPIVTEEGRGYSIMDGYKLPPVMFTEEEANALITAEQLILKNKDQSLANQYQSAITKIKSVLRLTQKEKVELLEDRIQVRANRYNQKTSNHLIELQSMISNFQVADMEYLSLNNFRSRRKIEPFALYTTKDNWVMVAYCRDKKDFRAFRLDCIQLLNASGEYFEPHKITLEQYLEQCREKWQNTPDIPLSSQPTTFVANQKNTIMQQVEIQPFHLIGITIRTTNQNGQAAQDIPLLWQRFMKEQIPQRIPNKVDDTVYALYTDYEGDHNLPYAVFIGCKTENLNEIPEGMTGKSFNGGKSVKFTAKGDLTNGLVINQWMKIWEMDLDRSYTTDFEVYKGQSNDLSDIEVEFFIAVN